MDDLEQLAAELEQLNEFDVGDEKTMTTNQVRDAYSRRKGFHDRLSAMYKTAVRNKDVPKAVAVRKHLGSNMPKMQALQAEFGKRNAAWKAAKHAGLRSRFNDPHDSGTRNYPYAHIENTEHEVEPEMTDAEVAEFEKELDKEISEPAVNPYETLVQSVFDEKPQQFVDNFDAIMRDRVSDLVAQRKLDLQQNLFGAPEGLEQPEPEVKEPVEEPKPLEAQSDAPPEGVEIEEDNWIQGVTNSSDFEKGSLTALAKAAGMSPMEYARKHYHDKGKIGEKARFAVNANK